MDRKLIIMAYAVGNKKQAILTLLEKYLTPFQVTYLRLSMAVPGSIGFCMTVNEIIHEYRSGQEEEKIVENLLQQLCIKHFNPTAIKNYEQATK